MASIFQPIRATTTLTSSTLSSRRFVAEKKVSFVVVRSGVVKDSGLKRICCRGDQFVTNAVAAKADTPAESTASKPGIWLRDCNVMNALMTSKSLSPGWLFIMELHDVFLRCGRSTIAYEFILTSFSIVKNGISPEGTHSGSLAPHGGYNYSHELLLFEALREGLEEEMERDARVCVIGEDVGHYGGSYKVTKGLADKYGDLRVLDTPIAENSFTGMGIGAAMTGLRPIIEGMNMGFLLLAFNQISNNCGMLHYTSGGQFKIPVVIRGPGGVGRQLGAEHSQRLESYFQSIPGIQMVACSTPYNAKGLMKAAIRSDNPVILFEHVLLYNLKERIPDEEYVLSLEEAEMVRPGEHVTILTYSRMRYHVMQAAKTLVNKGYDPEVIDIRSLKPFDLYTIGNSIKKTHRVLIVEECMRTGGIGASLTAAITENFNDYLDAPIMCLSSQDVPTPYAGTLEEWTVVQPPQIVAAVEQLWVADSYRQRIINWIDVARQLSTPFAFITKGIIQIMISMKENCATSEEELKDKQESMAVREGLSMIIATWNVARKSPTSSLNLEDWLHTSPSLVDHFMFLGFQEFVPLIAGNVLGTRKITDC
ncbi:pyruvate dehydrogenase E1 component subunit beta-3, chloroplastic-like protein [Tanacetum coccineum]|uniref:pyruvate dehydrogenase (acetyl-transferring) n=1 Tax=Tanacetum coccineum TaxID=301880 RepID=A0ABQ5EST0_9ASTR